MACSEGVMFRSTMDSSTPAEPVDSDNLSLHDAVRPDARALLSPGCCVDGRVAKVAGNSCTSELNILQQGVEICDAARREDLQAVKALLSAKTHVHIKNSQGWTALMYASNYGHVEMVQVLLAAMDDNNASAQASSALGYAVVRGHLEVTKLLLDVGADVNIVNVHGYTPLDYALKLSFYDIRDLLLASGAAATLDKTGQTPLTTNATQLGQAVTLCSSASRGQAADVKALLCAGYAVDGKNIQGQTALICASASGHFDVARLLIDAGADVNALDMQGQHALSHAMKNSCNDVEQLLLASGANVTDHRPKHGKHQDWKPWVLATLTTSVIFVVGHVFWQQRQGGACNRRKVYAIKLYPELEAPLGPK